MDAYSNTVEQFAQDKGKQRAHPYNNAYQAKQRSSQQDSLSSFNSLPQASFQMGPAMAAAQANNIQALLGATSAVLSDCFVALKKKCPTCFAVDGKFFDTHSHISACQRALGHTISMGTNKVSFKKAILLSAHSSNKDFSFCVGCQAPIKPYSLLCHDESSLGRSCPFDYLIAFTLFAFFSIQHLRSKLLKHFNLDKKFSLQDFQTWCSQSHPTSFTNYIAAFIWICKLRGLASSSV